MLNDQTNNYYKSLNYYPLMILNLRVMSPNSILNPRRTTYVENLF